MCGGGHHTSLHDAPCGAAAHAVVSTVASDSLEDFSGAPPTEIYSAPLDQGAASSTSETAASASSGVSSAPSAGVTEPDSPLVATVASEPQLESARTSGQSLPLLATAILRVARADGTLAIARALIDPASQVTLISSRLASRLRLPLLPVRGAIGLAAAQEAYVRGAVDILFHSASGAFVGATRARVVDQITGPLPPKSFDISGEDWSYARARALADPQFFVPASVDVLLDASLFSDVVGDSVHRGPPGFPVILDSLLGGLVFGRCPSHSSVPRVCVVADDEPLRALVERFWVLETCAPEGRPLLEDEVLAESHFLDTHRRASDGRFIVRLPFRPGMSGADLGLSRAQALRRLEHLRMRRLTPEYREFMSEYLSLGHMVPRPVDAAPHYFIPHHPVHRGSKI